MHACPRVQVQVDQVHSVYSQEATQEANQWLLLPVSHWPSQAGVWGDHLVRWALLTIFKGLKVSFSGIKHMCIVVRASHPPRLRLSPPEQKVWASYLGPSCQGTHRLLCFW